ncbi:MAG TPA: hypothetical protein DCS93_36755 [Microscillaceae bacterium]|nr:hypothetical protein [Microscillaceae bacterium]
MKTRKQLLLGIIVLLFFGNMAIAQNYEWVRQVGGTNSDEANSMAIDSDGNVYVTGYFYNSSDFDLGTSTAILNSDNVSSDIFIAKYSNQGEYIWAYRIGGTARDEAYSITIDTDNNIYITGFFEGTVDFDPGNGTSQLTSREGSPDIFVAKYNSNGEHQWAFPIGGTGVDRGYDITVDDLNNIYITGAFQSADVDFNPAYEMSFLTAKGSYDIFVVKYDQSATYQWAHNIGKTNSTSKSYAISIDNLYNVYLTGSFDGKQVDFDPSDNLAHLSSQGFASAIFIAKYDSQGKYLWAHSIGGISGDHGYDIKVDGSGYIYVAGEFRSSGADFDPGPGISTLNIETGTSTFIAKYRQDGQYQWAGIIQNARTIRSISNCLATDSKGNVYITGRFENTVDFDFGSGVHNLTSKGQRDAFFAKYDRNGVHQWAHSIGGTHEDRGTVIKVNKGNGDVYFAGLFEGGSIDFDLGSDTKNFTSNSTRDIFIAKYNSQETYRPQQLVSTGGNLNDYGSGIVLDDQENVYISGRFEGTVDFDPGPAIFELTSQGMADIFVAKYNSQGALQWAFSIGGSRDEIGNDITLDKEGNILIIGAISSTTVDFDPDTGVSKLFNQGSRDIFFAKYTNQGALLWAHNIGGRNIDYGDGIATDTLGNVYITGYFQGTDVDFNPGPGITNISSNGGRDIFLAKYNSQGLYQWVHHVGAAGSDVGTGIAVDRQGDVYLTGLFQHTVDFDPEVATHNQTSSGNYDTFIAKYDTDGNYQWAHKFGGIDGEGAGDIVTDYNDNVYITGLFQGIANFDPGSGSVSLTSQGSMDIFLAKYNTTGVYQWAHSIGGTLEETGRSVEVDRAGNVYITGFFKSANVDFDPSDGTHHLSSQGKEDVFVARYTPTGIFQWAYQIGGDEDAAGNDIAVSGLGHGHIYLTGYFTGNNVDFHTSDGVVTLNSNGGRDFFYTKTRVAACATPAAQPTNLVFNSPGETSLSIQSLTPPASTADGYLIKLNTVDSFTPPVQGALPNANTTYTGGEQVIYANEGLPNASLSVTGLTGNTQYYFKVYAFNKCGNTYLFETIGLSGNATTDRLSQSIQFDSLQHKTYGDGNFSLSAKASSGLDITYQSSNPAVATMVNNEVTIVGAGHTTIIATQAGNGTYHPASNTQQSLIVHKATQTIRFEALTEKLFGDSDFSLTATANSGLVVAYSSSNTAVATVTGNVVTIVGTGATIITAQQAGNHNYHAAGQVMQILTVEEANQSIQFNILPPKTFGEASFGLQATATSGLGITFTIADPTIATINGNQVTILKAGTTTITASQAGNTNFNPASSVTQTLIVNKKDQTIEFDLGIHATKSLSSDPFVLTATASSGLPVSFTSSDPSIVNITENVATITGSGTTTIVASQAGNINFNSAPSVARSIEVTIGRPTALKTFIAGRHTIQLSWKIALSQTQETRIERSTEKPDNFKVINQVNAQSYLDSSLSIRPGITYYYRVIAIGVGSEASLPSDTVGIKIPKIELVTGQQEEAQQSIQVFPNPGKNGVFHIRAPNHFLKNAKMILMDGQGKTLKECFQSRSVIDLSRQLNGIYYLKIITNQNEIIKTLIKQ